MIDTSRDPMWTWVMRKCLYEVLSRQFSAVYLRQSADVGQHHVPILFCANHSCRWDGPLGMFMSETALEIPSYVMLAQSVLQKYPWLRRIGGFDVDMSGPLQTSVSLQHAADLLRGHDNGAIWVFPQGKYSRNRGRPLKFQLGSAQLARLVGTVCIVPVAFHYDSFIYPKPEAFVSFGPPKILEGDQQSSRELTREMELEVTSELDSLQADVASNNMSRFRVILKGKDSLLFSIIKAFDPQWVNRAMPRKSSPL